jgi:transketolase
MNITDVEIRELEIHAVEMRQSVLDMLVHAGSGHTAGPLGMADIFSALYFKIMKHDPANPSWAHRDRLILSNGHICPILYASMAHSGYFHINQLLTLRKFGSILQGHPHREFLPSLENSSGPLGSGLSQAIGMALADRMDARENKSQVNKEIKHASKFFYCLMGDGEMNEGQVWEALMLLGKEKLSNVIVVIDRNKIQIDGNTEDVMPLEPLTHKLDNFNLNVIEIDGHDMRQICNAFEVAKNNTKNIGSKATVIVANTIPGKGYLKIEGDYHWHGKPVNKKEMQEAIDDMRTMYGRLTNN